MSDPGLVGKCEECGGLMVEIWLTYPDHRGRAQLRCQDCGEEAIIEYVRGEENPWENPLDREGVVDVTVEEVTWVDCFTCRGSGEVIGCIDDLCHARGECMHDGNDACPDCYGDGQVPRILDDNGEVKAGA